MDTGIISRSQNGNNNSDMDHANSTETWCTRATVPRGWQIYLITNLPVQLQWVNHRETDCKDFSIILSGPIYNSGQWGVALVLRKKLKSTLIDWKPISDRFLTSHLRHKCCCLSVTMTYALTDMSDTEIKDDFYAMLESITQDISQYDVSIILTDANKISHLQPKLESTSTSHRHIFCQWDMRWQWQKIAAARLYEWILHLRHILS